MNVVEVTVYNPEYNINRSSKFEIRLIILSLSYISLLNHLVASFG